jgi:Zn-dependent oligopeptidase
LQHDQLRTLVHELGHSLHATLSRPTHAWYSGTKNAYDFGEVPGLLLEKWCWLPDQLKKLSGHFKSSKPIPDDLVNNIIRARNANEKMLDPFQIAIAAFDLAIYTPASQKDAEEMNLQVLWSKINSELLGFKYAENR